MAILTGFLPFKNRIKTADGYKLQSLWTSSDTVECANGSTLTTVLGNKADLSSGKVPITQLPPNSKTVANDTARFALTTNDVHNGFIVEVTATGNMYIVEDDTNLDSEAGYKPLSSDWDSIMNKPDNIAFLEDDDEEMPSISPVLRQSNLVNNLNAITTGSPLDAAQGKVIGDKLDTVVYLGDPITGSVDPISPVVYQADIVNDLVTNDNTKPLSAAMGRQLNSTLSQKLIAKEIPMNKFTWDTNWFKATNFDLSGITVLGFIVKPLTGSAIMNAYLASSTDLRVLGWVPSNGTNITSAYTFVCWAIGYATA